MDKEGLLLYVARMLRMVGMLWMVFSLGCALASLLVERRTLTHAEQISRYEREVGHSIAEDVRKLAEQSRRAQDKRLERWIYVGEYEKRMRQSQVLRRHFGVLPPTRPKFDWINALRHLLGGILGLLAAWVSAWLLLDFRA